MSVIALIVGIALLEVGAVATLPLIRAFATHSPDIGPAYALGAIGAALIVVGIVVLFLRSVFA